MQTFKEYLEEMAKKKKKKKKIPSEFEAAMSDAAAKGFFSRKAGAQDIGKIQKNKKRRKEGKQEAKRAMRGEY